MYAEPFTFGKDRAMIQLTAEPFRDVLAGMTTRHGGVSQAPFTSLNLATHVSDHEEAVWQNRNIVASKLSVPQNKWVCAQQVHGVHIAKVHEDGLEDGTSSKRQPLPRTDGLYTRQPEIFLALFFADCVPIYFYAPKQRVIGLAHAGWRGSVSGIAPKMVRLWKDVENVAPEEIYVAIGPSIGACCYEVDDRVINAVHRQANEDGVKDVYSETAPGRYHLDLKAYNRWRLRSEGIRDDHIFSSTYCTGCRTDLFFSHRKEKQHTGRMMAYLLMRHHTNE